MRKRERNGEELTFLVSEIMQSMSGNIFDGEARFEATSMAAVDVFIIVEKINTARHSGESEIVVEELTKLHEKMIVTWVIGDTIHTHECFANVNNTRLGMSTIATISKPSNGFG